MKNLFAISAVAALAGSANASIGFAVSANAANDSFLSESITVAPGYDGNAMLNTWGPGDMFGITSRPLASSTPFGIPFAMADDSLVGFTSDTQGIIDENDNGRFFGLVDSANGDNPGSTGNAEWTFDVSGASSLSVNIDFAAMGDFEASNDAHTFTWSIDGSAPQPLFTSSIDEASAQNYTMAGGALVNLDDPMLINGVLLDNNFQTVSAGISGSGSVLTIAYEGEGDGGSEAVAFRNITVVPAPGAAGLLGFAGLAAARRRR